MVSNEEGVKLHHRKVTGQSLSPEEGLALQTWYELQDREEAQSFVSLTPSLEGLQAEIAEAEKRVVEMALRNQKLAAENEALRTEIALMKHRLKHPLPALAA